MILKKEYNFSLYKIDLVEFKSHRGYRLLRFILSTQVAMLMKEEMFRDTILPFATHTGYFISPRLHCTDKSDLEADGNNTYPCLHIKSIKSPCKIFPLYFHLISMLFLFIISISVVHGSVRQNRL